MCNCKKKRLPGQSLKYIPPKPIEEKQEKKEEEIQEKEGD